MGKPVSTLSRTDAQLTRIVINENGESKFEFTGEYTAGWVMLVKAIKVEATEGPSRIWATHSNVLSDDPKASNARVLVAEFPREGGSEMDLSDFVERIEAETIFVLEGGGEVELIGRYVSVEEEEDRSRGEQSSGAEEGPRDSNEGCGARWASVLEEALAAVVELARATWQKTGRPLTTSKLLVKLRECNPDLYSRLEEGANAVAKRDHAEFQGVLADLGVTKEPVGVPVAERVRLALDCCLACKADVIAFSSDDPTAPAWGSRDMKGQPECYRGQYSEDKVTRWREVQTQHLPYCDNEFGAVFVEVRAVLDARYESRPWYQRVDLEFGLARACKKARKSREAAKCQLLALDYAHVVTRTMDGVDPKLLPHLQAGQDDLLKMCEHLSKVKLIPKNLGQRKWIVHVLEAGSDLWETRRGRLSLHAADFLSRVTGVTLTTESILRAVESITVLDVGGVTLADLMPMLALSSVEGRRTWLTFPRDQVGRDAPTAERKGEATAHEDIHNLLRLLETGDLAPEVQPELEGETPRQNPGLLVSPLRYRRMLMVWNGAAVGSESGDLFDFYVSNQELQEVKARQRWWAFWRLGLWRRREELERELDERYHAAHLFSLQPVRRRKAL